MACGWRLKPLHRLIVLSQTYQRSSASRPGRCEGRPRRCLALAMAAAPSGSRGRPRRDPRGERTVEPEDGRARLLSDPSSRRARRPVRPGDGWGKSDDREQARRSIYIFAKRSLAVPELELLDTPDNTSSCERRIVSTTGPQALTFLNGAFVHEQARHFASRLVAEAGPVAGDQVERAFAHRARPTAPAGRVAGRPRRSSRSKSARSRPMPQLAKDNAEPATPAARPWRRFAW